MTSRIIYHVTCRDSGRAYVGQTTMSLANRIACHKYRGSATQQMVNPIWRTIERLSCDRTTANEIEFALMAELEAIGYTLNNRYRGDRISKRPANMHQRRDRRLTRWMSERSEITA